LCGAAAGIPSLKRVIKRVNVERGRIEADQQRGLKRLQIDRMLNFITRVIHQVPERPKSS
jgi:hypothetical protein